MAQGIRMFRYDVVTGEFYLNFPELKFIDEFNDLWIEAKRYAGCLDKDGYVLHGNPNAINKFADYCKYVFLCMDWASIYRDYPEKKKREMAKHDANLTDEEAYSDVMEAAIKKWDEIQSEDRNYRIVKAGQRQVDALISYFGDNDKLNKTNNGKPVYKATEIMAELLRIGSISDELDRQEERIKTGSEVSASLKADAIEGFLVDFAQVKDRKDKELKEANKLKKELEEFEPNLKK